MRRLKSLFVAILVVAMVLGTVPAFAAGTFDDVAGTPYEEAVNALAGLSKDGKAVITGDPSGAFRPNDAIKRSEVTAILARAFGLEGMANLLKGETDFSDVGAGHWASGYINLAASKGWVNGVGGGRFAPDDLVTYQQWVTMLVRALGFEAQAIENGGWPTGYEMVAFELGLTTGTDYNGAAPAPRGEVALMAYTGVFDVTPNGAEDTLAVSVFGQAPVAASIAITADAAKVALYDTVEFTATILDEDGNAVDADVTWSADLGIINAAGKYAASEAGTATVTATYGDMTATTELVVYGAAYGIALVGPADEIVANNSTVYEVVAQVVDENGNAVPEEDIDLTLSHSANNSAVSLETPIGTTDENGQVTFEVMGVMFDRTDTLAVTDDADNLEAGTIDLTTVEPVATAIKLTVTQTVLAVNDTGATMDIPVSIVDQAGVLVSTGVYELSYSVSGVAELTSDDTQWVVGGAAPVASIEGIKGETGDIVVTVTGEGLQAGVASIKAEIAGDPYKLTVAASNLEDITAAQAADFDSDDMVKVVVTVVDRKGTPVNTSGVTLDIGYDDDNLILHWDDGIADDGTVTIAAGTNSTEFYLVGEQAGEWAISVKDAATTGALGGGGSFVAEFVPGTATALSVTPAGNLDITSGTPVVLEASMTDVCGNAVPTAGVEVVFGVLPDALNTGSHTINGKTDDSITVKTDASGIATATLVAQQYTGDTYQVVATADAGIDFTGTFEVVPFLAKSIKLTTKDNSTGAAVSSILANDGVAVRVYAMLTDVNGLPVTGKTAADLSFSVASGGGGWDVDADANGVADNVVETADDGLYYAVFEPGTQGVSVITVTFKGQVNEVASSTTLLTKIGVPHKIVAYNQAGKTTEETAYDGAGVYGPYTIAMTDFGGNAVVSQAAYELTNGQLLTLTGLTSVEVRTTENGLNQSTLVFGKGTRNVSIWVVGTDGDTYGPTGEIVHTDWIPAP